MNKLLTIKLSPAQFKALRQLEQTTGENKSELVRHALVVFASQHDVTFPQNVAKRGEYKRNTKD